MKPNSPLLEKILATALGEHITAYLRDPLVTEVRINSCGGLWINRLGEGKRDTGLKCCPQKTKQAIYAVAYGVHAVCNDALPTISAELPGTGERFQGVLPPLTKDPVIVIRKKATQIFTLSDLVSQGVLSEESKRQLELSVQNKENILIVGGTDSGKTTFANALLEVMGRTRDRIVIIEDTQELQCNGEEVEYLRTKDGVATLRDLVKVTLRLSPDRIVIGEVRGAEALDLLKAWNTGHGGGVSTVHASGALKGLTRLEQLVQEAGVPPTRALIAEAGASLLNSR